MENLWNTSPAEELLFLLFLLCFLYALGLFLFAVTVTVLAMAKRYSVEAIALYWSVFSLALICCSTDHELWGFLAFAFTAPPVSAGMMLFQRRRSKKINTQQTN
jgi:hypothetical protein